MRQCIVVEDSFKNKKLILRQKKRINIIPLIDIILINRESRKICIICKNNKSYEIELSLKEILTQLPKESFFQSHKSYIINPSYVNKIELSTSYSYKISFEYTLHSASLSKIKYPKLLYHLKII